MRKVYASLRDGMSKPSDWFKVQEEADQPTASKALDAMRGQPMTQEHPRSSAEQRQALMPEAHIDQAPPSETQSETVDHSSAYADHSAAIESASTVQEWQEAYTAAWQWAESTGSDSIKKDIKQLAGEAKKKLTQQ